MWQFYAVYNVVFCQYRAICNVSLQNYLIKCVSFSKFINVVTLLQLEKTMARQCMPTGSISNYTVANLQSMGCLALSMSAANIDMINPLVLCNATIQMTGCDVPKAVVCLLLCFVLNFRCILLKQKTLLCVS